MMLSRRLPGRYIFVVSFVGSLLLSLMPIILALESFMMPDFYYRLLDVTLLFLLVLMVFYSGISLNLRWCNLPNLKKFSFNLGFYFFATSVCIAIHYPIWKTISHIPIQFYFNDEVVRNLIVVLISFFAVRLYVKITENQQLKEAYSDLKNQHLNGQLNALMNQINPHFFFNAMNTLSGLIRENPDKSEIFIDKLSQVFRFVLNIQENSRVTLMEEIKFAEDYIFLLKVRFENKLVVNFNVDKDSDAKVPSLCTQLLIENGIKHNRMNQQFPVIITIEADGEYLVVRNNLQPQVHAVNSTGTGLKNLNSRSILLSGKPIVIEKTDAYFCVKVPLIHE